MEAMLKEGAERLAKLEKECPDDIKRKGKKNKPIADSPKMVSHDQNELLH